MTAHDSQTFFKPDEFSCQQTRLLSQTYNLAHVLLNRSKSSYLFVPVRSLQYLAIVEKKAFWFVDSLAYAVRGDEGGRLIRVSWHPLTPSHERTDLTQPMACKVIFYGEDMSEIQSRLNSEFYKSMQLLDQRYRDSLDTNSTVCILPMKPANAGD